RRSFLDVQALLGYREAALRRHRLCRGRVRRGRGRAQGAHREAGVREETMNFTATLVYWADDRTAYWFTTTENNVPRRYCANDYATFHDWRLGDRQVPGYHSSPVGAADMGAWFRRWLRERSG